MVIKHVTDGKGGHYGYSFLCPGCRATHTIPTEPYPGGWSFNGDEGAPTFAPSILCYPVDRLDDSGNRCESPRCHSFVRSGRIEFLSDCGHELAGKTVPLPEVI